ncbi:MAG: response regulator, partial [Caldilineaceae bacterium]|nr:response regulator [Caldilineaceae bacterium]
QAAVGAADVCACVDEVLDLLRPTLPSTIELLRQCDLPDAYVLADSHEIVQVIMNLCTNAYQAIGEAPGRIIVRVERVPGVALAPPAAATDSASPPEWVRLTVQDSGDGIDPEAREHLFEPFFTTKGAGKGTGLGLPVVYGIVRKLGGRIDFESTPGRGTSFVVELPAMVGTPATGVEGLATDERGQGEHILLVDDDAATRDQVERYLSTTELEVQSVTNGREALNVLSGLPVDLVLLDLMMPVMDG